MKDTLRKMQLLANAISETARSFQSSAEFRDDLLAEIEKKDKEIERLLTLVDGVMEVVEIYHADSPAQKQWKKYWMDSAREALKEKPDEA